MASLRGRVFEPYPGLNVLAQELQDGLRHHVGLGQHSRAGLHQDLAASEVRHLLGHIHVADAGLGGLQVFSRNLQVGDAVLQAVLQSTELGTVTGDIIDGLIDVRNGLAGIGLGGDVDTTVRCGLPIVGLRSRSISTRITRRLRNSQGGAEVALAEATQIRQLDSHFLCAVTKRHQPSFLPDVHFGSD